MVEAKKKISRQAHYQHRKRDAGKCRICGGPQWRVGLGFCLTHFLSRRLYYLGLFEAYPNAKARERIINFTYGVFHGAEHGTRPPFRNWYHAADVALKTLYKGKTYQWDPTEIEAFARFVLKYDKKLRKEVSK